MFALLLITDKRGRNPQFIASIKSKKGILSHLNSLHQPCRDAPNNDIDRFERILVRKCEVEGNVAYCLPLFIRDISRLD